MLRTVLLPALVLAVASCKTDQPAPPVTKVTTAADVAGMTPDQVVERLKEGNLRFVSDSLTSMDWKAQLEASASGTSPLVAVLTTCDSRIPIPLVFDARIGDVETVRTPGPVVNDGVRHALERSATAHGVKAIVVLAHSDCESVAAACEGRDAEHLGEAIEAIRPAVDATPRDEADRIVEGVGFVDSVAITHASRTCEALRASSATLRDLEANGALRIVAGYYDVPTGAIVWL